MKWLNRVVWILVGIIGVMLVHAYSTPAHASEQTPESCQWGADVVYRVAQERDKGYTYAEAVFDFMQGVARGSAKPFAKDDADVKFLFDGVILSVFENPNLPASVLSAEFKRACLGQPARMDTSDGFTHRPGESHLSDITANEMYREAWVAYKARHPEAKAPPRGPKVGHLDSEGMCIATRSQRLPPCPIGLTGGEYGGFPLPGGMDIMVDESLDYDHNAFAQSVLVHEFIHYLQFYNQGPRNTCAGILEYEREAYAVQQRWLAQNGGGQYVMRVMLTGASQRCANQP